MLLRPTLLLSIGMALPLLVSCTGVTISDEIWCGSLGPEGAVCFHTLTNDTETMTLQQFAVWWDDTTDPKVATSTKNLLAIKSAIEKFCSDETCSYDMTAQVNSISQKLNSAISAAQPISKP